MIIGILDFDDTIFPTSHYDQEKNEIKSESSNILSDIDDSAYVMMSRYRNIVDQLYIITNATIEWVNKVFPLLKKTYNKFSDVTVISSRRFTDEIPFHYLKTVCFISLVENLGSYKIKSIYAAGDNPFDRNASIAIKKLYPNITVKNIKYDRTIIPEDLVSMHMLSDILLEFQTSKYGNTNTNTNSTHYIDSDHIFNINDNNIKINNIGNKLNVTITKNFM